MESRHVLKVILSAVAGLLVVPVAVNVGTGGDAPSWLKPLVHWLWPIAIACVVLVVVLELWEKRQPGDRMSVRRPDDPRNVDLALTQVARYVDARQRGSLGEQMRIALALDERPEVVRQPAHLVQRIGGDEFQLSADLTIADVFARMNESMLLLGAPGAGKTTQLLDLAQALIAQARSSTSPHIPVVVDLADWVLERRRAMLGQLRRGAMRATFEDWLVSSIARRYKIPKEIGRLWLVEDRFTLLLDGLDEVPDADRERCVAEINALQPRYGVTRVAVCSREADYAQLNNQLRLQGAVVIRSLDRATTQRYLASVSPALADVVATLEADEELWELLTTPLMLAIMVVARVDQGSHSMTDTPDPVARRRQLFDAYVVEVLARRRSRDHGDPESALRAIRTLALASRTLDAGVRVAPLDQDEVDRYLPEAVAGVGTMWIAPVAALAAGVAVTAAAAAQFGGFDSVLPATLGLLCLMGTTLDACRARIEYRWLFAVVLLACAAVPSGLVVAALALLNGPVPLGTAGASYVLLLTLALVVGSSVPTSITATEPIGTRIAVAAIGLAAAGGVLLVGLRPRLIEGWTLGLVLATSVALFMVFAIRVSPPRTRSAPVARVVRIQRLVYVAAAVALVIILADGWAGPSWERAVGFLLGFVYGFATFFLAYCFTIGEQFVRLTMVIAGEPVPWRRSFLRFAADRSLLTRTDGEYRFIHLLVRDHLADCDPPRLAAAVRHRRTELLQPVP